MTKVAKVSIESENLAKDNFLKFKEVFPQFVRDGEIDFDNLQKFFKEQDVLGDKEKYGLSWAGKSNAFKAIKTSSAGTLAPAKSDSKNWDTTENLFIEGDNLEVLKLLQKNYREKIKMIYIDPPYNTGHDFVYKDNFTESVADYYEKTGQTENGIKMSVNTEKNGRFHSDWLTMMYPRLFLARNLLKEDGVIFISIDDNEVANLRLMCDEIFGEENFSGQFVVNSTPNARDYGHIGKMHEFVLFYTKKSDLAITNLLEDEEKDFKYSDDIGQFNIHPLYNSNVAFGPHNRKNLYYPFYLDPNKNDTSDFYKIGLEKKGGFIEIYPPESQKGDAQFVWRWGKDKSASEVNKEILGYKTSDGEFRIVQKMRHSAKLIRSLLIDKKYSSRKGTAEVEAILSGKFFSFPKPVNLIKDLVSVGSVGSEIILDFFAGSGTTAHAVMDLNAEDGGNRRFICVQIPEATDEESEAFKAGYKTIAEISKERIRRAGEKVKEDNKDKENIQNLDIGFKVFKLQNSNFRKWNVLTGESNVDEVKVQAKLLIDKPLVDRYREEDVIQEVLLKEGFSLNSKVEQRKTKSKMNFFFVNDLENAKQAFITFEEELSKEKVDGLEIPKDTLFVCFDSALDDNLKVNISRNLILKTI